ncbi:MAG: Ig-like domain-containing protein [Gemmatimonadales bacterium]
MRRKGNILLVVTGTAAIVACGSERSLEPQPVVPTAPSAPVETPPPLTFMTLSPSEFTVLLGDTVQLVVATFDGSSRRVEPIGTTIYTSRDSTVAIVSSTGLVTGVGAGTAQINVSFTSGGITVSNRATAQIRPEVVSAELVLRRGFPNGWVPSAAMISAGTTVRWYSDAVSEAGVPHTKVWIYDAAYRIVATVDLSSGSGSYRFIVKGDYTYCSGGCFDTTDGGRIQVR